MRLARLVAAGLALGAAAGFVGAFLRPRSVHSYHPVRVADDAVLVPPVTEVSLVRPPDLNGTGSTSGLSTQPASAQPASAQPTSAQPASTGSAGAQDSDGVNSSDQDADDPESGSQDEPESLITLAAEPDEEDAPVVSR